MSSVARAILLVESYDDGENDTAKKESGKQIIENEINEPYS